MVAQKVCQRPIHGRDMSSYTLCLNTYLWLQHAANAHHPSAFSVFYLCLSRNLLLQASFMCLMLYGLTKSQPIAEHITFILGFQTAE